MPSPRDIPEVIETRKTLPVDQLWAKYYPEPEAYERAQHEFLNNPLLKNYTHFTIAPDDLVIEPRHYEKLVGDLLKYDYPVLCGVCNPYMSPEYRNYVAVCEFNIPRPRWMDGRRLDWATVWNPEKEKEIRKVLFAGFPFMFIRRDIMERVKFRPDYSFNDGVKAGASMDITFCWDCFQNDIPIYADFGCHMLHRHQGGFVKVGKKNSVLYLQTGRFFDTTSLALYTELHRKNITKPRLIAAISVRNEEQFIHLTFESLLKILDLDAVYVMDGSYMKGYHDKSDSTDATKAICNVYSRKFKEFYFRPAFGRFYESQSQKRNELFDWIDSFDTDQPLWIIVIDGDEEMKFVNKKQKGINLKPILEGFTNDIVLMETKPFGHRCTHPLDHIGVRIFKGKSGIRWDPNHTMRYVNNQGEILADYSPNVHLICTPHHFVSKIYFDNYWLQRPQDRLDEKKKYLLDRAQNTNERKAELKNV